jgi:hypothetical protein
MTQKWHADAAVSTILLTLNLNTTRMSLLILGLATTAVIAYIISLEKDVQSIQDKKKERVL